MARKVRICICLHQLAASSFEPDEISLVSDCIIECVKSTTVHTSRPATMQPNISRKRNKKNPCEPEDRKKISCFLDIPNSV